MKIVDLVLLSLFMIKKSATSLMPLAQHQLKWYSILNTKCIDPVGPEKMEQHWDEVGATFYGRNTALSTHCCEYKKSGKKSIPREQNKPNKTDIRYSLFLYILY